jgi:hypothetical protein
MKLTNKLGLPQPIVDAVTFDDYTKGDADFSVTSLSKPSLQMRLKEDYKDYIVEDAADRIWALFGTAVHEVLERAAKGKEERSELEDEYVVETRLVGEFGRWKVSGKQDIYMPGKKRIIDYKTVSYFAIMNGPKPEWTKQLNALAAIHRQHGQQVESLQVVAILKDWSYTKAYVSKEIPWKSPVAVINVPVWSDRDATSYIIERCESHGFAMETKDVYNIPACTDDECWAKPTRYAVMKKGGKRALRVFDDRDVADKHLVDYLAKPLAKGKMKDPTKFHVKVRPGQRTHCERYCPVSKNCWAYTKWKEQNNL